MNGVAIIIILLVPMLFQVVRLSVRQSNQYRELQERLGRIETAIRAQSAPDS